MWDEDNIFNYVITFFPMCSVCEYLLVQKNIYIYILIFMINGILDWLLIAPKGGEDLIFADLCLLLHAF